MQSNNYSAYVALGQQRVLVLILTAHLIVVLPLMIFLGGKFGILGVAYAELTASAASLAVGYPVLFKTLKISVRNLLQEDLASTARCHGDGIHGAGTDSRGDRNGLCTRVATRAVSRDTKNVLPYGG